MDNQMATIRPITPAEALTLKRKSIPSEVFEAVNTLLMEQSASERQDIILRQDDVVNQIIAVFAAKNVAITSDEIFARHLLDFEDHYRRAGWKVAYDSPRFGETFTSFFRFNAVS